MMNVCIPNAIESSRISTMLASDVSIASASRALQRGGENQLEMTYVRSMFDKLINRHPGSVEELAHSRRRLFSSFRKHYLQNPGTRSEASDFDRTEGCETLPN